MRMLLDQPAQSVVRQTVHIDHREHHDSRWYVYRDFTRPAGLPDMKFVLERAVVTECNVASIDIPCVCASFAHSVGQRRLHNENVRDIDTRNSERTNRPIRYDDAIAPPFVSVTRVQPGRPDCLWRDAARIPSGRLTDGMRLHTVATSAEQGDHGHTCRYPLPHPIPLVAVRRQLRRTGNAAGSVSCPEIDNDLATSLKAPRT